MICAVVELPERFNCGLVNCGGLSFYNKNMVRRRAVFAAWETRKSAYETDGSLSA